MAQPAAISEADCMEGRGGPGRTAPHVLERIENLPTLPPLISKVIKTVEDERSSAWELERIVRHDQSLSSKLLSVANSAYYGFAQEINTVTRAVVVLGLNEVRKICLGAGMAQLVHTAGSEGLKRVEPLWDRALMAAETCRILAIRTRKLDQEQAFTAGLLHDLGWLVLTAFFPDDLEGLLKLRALMKVPMREAEAMLELDHEDLGLRLAENWHLPPMMAEVMGRHHEPSPHLAYSEMVSAVHISDCLAREFLEPDGDYADYGPAPEAMACLEMEEADLWWARKRVEKRAPALTELRKALMG